MANVNSDDSTFPFQGIEKKHLGEIGKMYKQEKHQK